MSRSPASSVDDVIVEPRAATTRTSAADETQALLALSGVMAHAPDKPLVMREPVRYFPYAADFHVPLHATLLTPFGRGGRLVGTVWVASHDPRKEFSTEDVRIVEKMTTFATSLLDALQVRRRRGTPGG